MGWEGLENDFFIFCGMKCMEEKEERNFMYCGMGDMEKKEKKKLM